MKSLSLAFVFTLYFMSLGHANELCQKAQIIELKLGESDNLCLTPEAKLSTTQARVLTEISAIHHQVAKLLRVEVSELFNRPLRIDLSEYIFGPFFSIGTATQLNVGVYPGDDFKFNTGVYLHELGHVLAAGENPKLPSLLGALNRSVLFVETFADLLALSVHGEIITPDEKGTCLDRLRYVTTFQSYNYPLSYFQNFNQERIKKCCESLVKNTTITKYLDLCEMAEEYYDPTASLEIDNHQIGLPILSFFKDFALKTNQTMGQIFDRIFFSGKVNSVETLLNDFKQTLSVNDQVLFDKLYQKHALHKMPKL